MPVIAGIVTGSLALAAVMATVAGHRWKRRNRLAREKTKMDKGKQRGGGRTAAATTTTPGEESITTVGEPGNDSNDDGDRDDEDDVVVVNIKAEGGAGDEGYVTFPPFVPSNQKGVGGSVRRFWPLVRNVARMRSKTT
ncbi:hypothetical protein PG994_014192 [Apiospora phragmitis]|uniref:Uncharacterized protein n=1 Tax=Apiospora phragmitis TaxID=2905665 RepID=A0ABR1T3K9_9PEZI